MSKKVLVIEDNGMAQAAFLVKAHKAAHEADKWENFFEEYSPGDLLAEVKGEIEIQETCTGNDDRKIVEVPYKLKEGQPVLVLILDAEAQDKPEGGKGEAD